MEVTGSVPMSPGFSFDYCCGWNSQEIYAIGIKYNIIPMEGIFGGEIEIWHSLNAGASWELLHFYSPGDISEDGTTKPQIVFFSYANGIIRSKVQVRVYDISCK